MIDPPSSLFLPIYSYLICGVFMIFLHGPNNYNHLIYNLWIITAMTSPFNYSITLYVKQG